MRLDEKYNELVKKLGVHELLEALYRVIPCDDFDEYLNIIADAHDVESYECAICGQTYYGYGNDPYPVVEDEDARCCDLCNQLAVVPLRIERATRAYYEEQKASAR